LAGGGGRRKRKVCIAAFNCPEYFYDEKIICHEFSFRMEKEIIPGKLEKYFEDSPAEEMVFDEEKETADDPRAKANIVLKTLKDCGWIEYEIDNDYTVIVNLLDHAALMNAEG
jgi:hypothetical protein